MRRQQFIAESECAFSLPVRSPRDWMHEGAPILDVAHDFEAAKTAKAPPFAQILVTHWPEELGKLESVLTTCATLASERAVLAMSLQSARAPSVLREQLCGDRAVHAANPLLCDREIGFEIRRVVRACALAGFVVDDVQQKIDPLAARFDDVSRAALRAAGQQVEEALDRRCERFYVRARRACARPASILIAQTGDGHAAAEKLRATREALARFLPETCEVVVGKLADHESISWNDAFARSAGERLWLLRAGDGPSRGQFEQLDACASSVVLAHGDSRVGLGGAILDRAFLLAAGPFIHSCDSQIVAGEEWRLRVEQRGMRLEECELREAWKGELAPVRAADIPAAQALVERWDMAQAAAFAAKPAVERAPWRVEGREPRVSLCMIVRDEERFLAACLGRVAGAVDEMVIVDTGSTDRTVEIAEEQGARVLQHAWTDDFSEARNHGIEAATGDWILVLDADELVDEGSVAMLRELAKSEIAAGFYLNFINDHESHASRGISMPRMFRRFDGVRFEGVIHEQVIESLQPEAESRGLAVYPSDVRVLHFGYSDEIVAARDKDARNDALFRKQLERTPEHPYFLYKYADFLRSSGAPAARVRSVLRRAYDALIAAPRERLGSAPFAGEVAALLALELAREEEYAEAYRLIRTALRVFPPTPNALYVAGGIAQSLDQHVTAIDCFDRLIDFGSRRSVVPVQAGITTFIARALRAVSLAALGHEDLGSEILASVRRENASWEAVWLHSASLALRCGHAQEAARLLAEAARQLGPTPALQSLAQHILQGVRLQTRQAGGPSLFHPQQTSSLPRSSRSAIGALASTGAHAPGTRIPLRSTS